ncbi:hypothetical protein ACFSTD_09805 [Novosphingobium colocasiae]
MKYSGIDQFEGEPVLEWFERLLAVHSFLDSERNEQHSNRRRGIYEDEFDEEPPRDQSGNLFMVADDGAFDEDAFFWLTAPHK